MIPTPRTEYEQLSRSDSARVDAACDRFEKAWKVAAANGERPAIPTYCTDFGEPERTVLVWELIALDRAYRTARGEIPRPEDYQGLCAEYDAQLPLTAPTQSAAADGTRTTVGPWPNLPGLRIVEVLGAGGMGVVYKAWQAALDRYVAVKMLRNAALAEPEQRERFAREARAVAQMQHPNLVQVFAVGEAPAFEGAAPSPYFVLEYVSGGSLADHLKGAPQRPRAAAHFVLTLARAMAHVHAQGIVHRDLKPANILMQVETGRGAEKTPGPPTAGSSAVLHDAFYRPKITDFGLAKLGGDSGLTRTGDALGTPSYMAPEQTDAKLAAIGPATDIYGLGAILYEALTGRPPFQAETPLATVMQVRTDEPVSLHRLQPTVPRDLETICLKCLRKEPRRRYASADALADDLSRFLDGEPIHARPVSAVGRAAKWARRRPMVAALAALVLVLAVGGFAGVLTQWLRAEGHLTAANDAREAAIAARAKETAALDRNRIIRAYDEWLADNAKAAHALLRDTTGRKDTWEWRYVNRLCQLGRHVFDDHQAQVTSVAFTPDGRTLVCSTRDGFIYLRDLVDGKSERVTLAPDRTEELSCVAVSPGDGRYLAVIAGSGNLYIWDLVERRAVADWQAHEAGWAPNIVYSPDGRFLATSQGTTVKIWDAHRRHAVRTMFTPQNVLRIDWSADGRYVAAAARGKNYLFVWEAVSGQVRKQIETVVWLPTCVAFSPDNRHVAWGGMDGVVAIHETAKFDRVRTLAGMPGYQACMAFSPDGRLVAAGSINGPAKIWNVETSQLVATLHGHSSGTREMAFSPDGSQLATVGSDRRVVVWDVTDQQEVSVLPSFAPGRLAAVAFSPDGRLAATAIRQFGVWDLERRLPVGKSHNADGISVAFHPGGKQFAGGDRADTVRVFDTNCNEITARTMRGPPLALRYSDDGKHLLVAGWENSVQLWDPATNATPTVVVGPLTQDHGGPRYDECRAAFSPDGRWLAYAEWKQPLDVWDLQTGAKVLTLTDGPKYPTALTFDPASHFLAVGGSKGEIQIRNARTGDQTAAWVGHPREVTGLSFTQNATRLASVAGDGCVRLWDTGAGEEVLSLRGQATFDTNIGFSPDGEMCVAGGLDGYLRLWSVKGSSTDSPEVWLARRRAWHEQVAKDSLLARQWFSARHHFSYLIPFEPAKAEYHAARGQSNAELGEWDKAAADFDAAMQCPDCSIIAYADRAHLYLRAGDADGYRRVCQRMLDVFGRQDSYFVQNALTRACSLAPESVPKDRLMDHAERARAKAPQQERYTALSTFGLALYRAGQAEAAITQLDEASRQRRKGGTVEDWLVLALAHQRVGREAKAREWYARAAEEITKTRTAASLSDGRTLNWWLRIELDVLFHEAKSALGAKAP